MNIEQIRPGLEIDENPRLHELGWKVQPYAWAIIFLFILTGLFGLFGKGFLSKKEMSQSGSRIKYESALREGSVTVIEFHDLSGAEETTVAIPVKYLKNFKTESIFPEPSETNFTGETVSYVFMGVSKDKHINFYLEPLQSGRLSAEILVNNAPFHISNLIYP